MVRARVNGSNKRPYRVKARALGLQLVQCWLGKILTLVELLTWKTVLSRPNWRQTKQCILLLFFRTKQRAWHHVCPCMHRWLDPGVWPVECVVRQIDRIETMPNITCRPWWHVCLIRTANVKTQVTSTRLSTPTPNTSPQRTPHTSVSLYLPSILLAHVGLAIVGYLFLAARWNRAGYYIFALWFLILLSCFFLSFSSPNLSRRRLDVCHTCTHGVALVRI